MKLKFMPFGALVVLVTSSGAANAAITCTIGSPGFVSLYDALATTDNLNQSSYTINCSRLASDPNTFNYVTFTDDGLYNTGPNNRAKLTTAATYLAYDFFTTSSYALNWSKSAKCIVGPTINFGGALQSTPQTTTYYSKLVAGQASAQGNYVDTVTVFMSYNQNACGNNLPQSTSGNFQVQISNVPACQIAVPPSGLSFVYTAFQTSVSTATNTFSTRCSTSLAYTMALDATSGVVGGLSYTIALSATGGTGNGALQGYSINGSMPLGQAGTCTTSSCSATDARMLTVTY